jgi:hypothetical protein
MDPHLMQHPPNLAGNVHELRGARTAHADVDGGDGFALGELPDVQFVEGDDAVDGADAGAEVREGDGGGDALEENERCAFDYGILTSSVHHLFMGRRRERERGDVPSGKALLNIIAVITSEITGSQYLRAGEVLSQRMRPVRMTPMLPSASPRTCRTRARMFIEPSAAVWVCPWVLWCASS